jgi:hypothetical protein
MMLIQLSENYYPLPVPGSKATEETSLKEKPGIDKHNKYRYTERNHLEGVSYGRKVDKRIYLRDS